jgi:hypothetical protein
MADPGFLPPVPEKLAATITRLQPYRDRVIDDARLWCSCLRPIGFGMEIEVNPSLEVSSFESCQRVAQEHGEWRIVQLWDDRTRAEVRDQYLMLHQHFLKNR